MEHFITCSDGAESEVPAIKNQDLCSKMACTLMRIRQCMSVKSPTSLSYLFIVCIYTFAAFCTLIGIIDPGHSTQIYKKGNALADNFKKVTSVETVISYISEELIPALHQKEIHNYDGIKETGVTPLYDTKLLGLVQIRQLRVKNESCSFAMEVRNLRGRYSPEFILSTEDRGNYGISWSPFDAYSCKAASSPWTYNTAWDSEHQKTAALFYHGEFASYPEGGYIATLGPKRNNSLATFQSLTNNSWLDKRTRAIFIDFTLYDPTTYILSAFNLRMETSAAGTVFSSCNNKTTTFRMNYRTLGESFLAPGVTCLIALCYFILLQCHLCCDRSLRSKYGSCYRALDLTIIVLSLAGVVLYLRASTCLSESIKMIEEDHNQFFDFKDMESLDAIMLVYAALLGVLSIVRFDIVFINLSRNHCRNQRIMSLAREEYTMRDYLSEHKDIISITKE